MMFLSVTNEAAALYLESNPFGESVAVAFPSASQDIQEAMKCFACERYTATVFHLMRAAEALMRVLAGIVGQSLKP